MGRSKPSLRGWFRAPQSSDEEETRIARVVHVLGIGVLVAVSPALLHNAIVGNWASVGVLAFDQALVVVCLWLNHHGGSRLAARLVGISSIALVASLQATGKHGVHDVAGLIYPAVIVLAGTLMDRRWFVTMTLLAMLAMAGQYVAELTGTVVNALSHYTGWRQLIDAEMILVVSALSVELLMRSLRDSMNQSRSALASLRESEALYRTLFESVSEAILLHDIYDGAIVDVNHRACELYGYSAEELRSLPVSALSVAAAGNRQADALRYISEASVGRPQRFEWQALARDGRAFWVEVHMRQAVVAGTTRVLVSVRDIDERKRAAIERQHLEEQLHQAQKMESIGRLAGGVAHDFNNLLTCIGGNADLALTQLAPEHPVAQNLAEIQDAVRRASALTRRLLAFSRKQPIEPRPLDLKVLLGSIHRMFERLVGETIRVEFYVAGGTLPILADPNQIEQILLNLVVNARDAMPQGGEVKIEVCNAGHIGDAHSQFVRIRVADTGFGILAEVLPKIFEPFYTTKPVGKGTGLGLSMVLGAVQQNGGKVDVQSSPGRGSTFDIYFPALTGKVGELGPAISGTVSPVGVERLLLVEDDPSVRQTGRQILEQLGYSVLACAGSAEAIAAVEDQMQRFDMLVTDVILPGLDGKALADRLQKQLSMLRVLYVSGYTADIIAHRGVIDDGLAFLAKPYSREELGRKVRSILDRVDASVSGQTA